MCTLCAAEAAAGEATEKEAEPFVPPALRRGERGADGPARAAVTDLKTAVAPKSSTKQVSGSAERTGDRARVVQPNTNGSALHRERGHMKGSQPIAEIIENWS